MNEVTAEFEQGALAAPPELRVRPRVSLAAKSDLGRVREHNEDKFEFFMPETPALLAARGQAFVVCDGMGGHAAGQIASELAAKTFLDVYYTHPTQDAEAAARAAVTAANRYVLDVARAVPSRRGMGTTLSALILLQDAAMVVQVGDSRVYRLRVGGLEQVSEEHTWVAEAIASGTMSAEEAESHPYRHMLTRAIGAEASLEPQLACFPLEVGDVYLLCSDGLTNHVTDEAIAEDLASLGIAEAVWRLVGRALADGGSDNCTAVAVRVDALESVG